MYLLFKNAFVKVKKSLGRFFSLLLIVALGAGFFTGIKSSSPDIVTSVDNYFDNNNLMDFRITSTVGLTDDDVLALKNLNNIDSVIPSYSIDVISENEAIRVHSILDEINNITLVDGRMPQKSNECLADSKYYKIGDIVEIDNNENNNLMETSYTVVGTINSVLYIFNEYGISNIGNGKLKSYIYILPENFNISYYTEIYVTALNTKETMTYSDEYDNRIKLLEDELLQLKPIRETKRYEEILEKATNEIITAENELKNIKRSLETNHQLPSNDRKKLEQEIINAEIKINSAKEELKNIEKPKWYLLDRTDNKGYINLKEDTLKVSLIAQVLPPFFMIIVALMSLNTMTRMIEEERGELGTLASLGYNNAKITLIYIMYVLIATILGIIIGFFIGTSLIPSIIYSVYNSLYNLPPLILEFNMIMFFSIIAISVTLMCLVTLIACLKELKNNPAILLRPIPPKKGKKIGLETIDFIWKRLSFIWKVTVRNIFRYKKRVFMTVIGIAGCSALLLTGFGIKDSVDKIAKIQYEEIFKYDNLIILNKEIKSIDEDFEKILEKENVIKPTLIYQTNFTFEYNKKDLELYLIVPSNEEEFYKYFSLNSIVSDQPIILDNDGVVITQKIAKLLKIKINDTIKIRDSNNQLYILKVADIVENYTNHYLYINYQFYEQIFEQEINYNIIVSNNEGDESLMAENLIASGKIANIVFTTDSLKTFNDLISGLNKIIFLIIGASALLALIVLYNLTTINISERKREIATLKVLGFYDDEVNEYIYRETFLLTLMGIGIGLIMGIFLHQFVIRLVEIDNTVFIKTINGISYFYSILITIIFAVIIQISTYFKLKKIDMIESLKSVE